MNIDKNLLNTLASLDDASLSSAIKMIAASGGIGQGALSFDKSSLDALRSALRGATDSDIAAIKKLFDEYKGTK